MSEGNGGEQVSWGRKWVKRGKEKEKESKWDTEEDSMKGGNGYEWREEGMRGV